MINSVHPWYAVCLDVLNICPWSTHICNYSFILVHGHRCLHLLRLCFLAFPIDSSRSFCWQKGMFFEGCVNQQTFAYSYLAKAFAPSLTRDVDHSVLPGYKGLDLRPCFLQSSSPLYYLKTEHFCNDKRACWVPCICKSNSPNIPFQAHWSLAAAKTKEVFPYCRPQQRVHRGKSGCRIEVFNHLKLHKRTLEIFNDLCQQMHGTGGHWIDRISPSGDLAFEDLRSGRTWPFALLWKSKALKPVLRSKGFCWVDSEVFRVPQILSLRKCQMRINTETLISMSEHDEYKSLPAKMASHCWCWVWCHCLAYRLPNPGCLLSTCRQRFKRGEWMVTCGQIAFCLAAGWGC